MEQADGNAGAGKPEAPNRRSWGYWKLPVWFGLGLCVLQVLVAVIRFGTMHHSDPFGLLIALPSIASGLVIFFIAGALIGLLAQRMLKGVSGTPRVWILVGLAITTPLAVLFSLVGGLLGPHMVVIYALVPFLVLVGIPMLIRAIWLRLRGA
ncbi:MAG: hypothetical protein J4F39_09670 [Candidatus Latescibacteria bacterium]|nr:hypothetical protein [Candidatus Latescibacterota bacterium]